MNKNSIFASFVGLKVKAEDHKVVSFAFLGVLFFRQKILSGRVTHLPNYPYLLPTGQVVHFSCPSLVLDVHDFWLLFTVHEYYREHIQIKVGAEHHLVLWVFYLFHVEHLSR